MIKAPKQLANYSVVCNEVARRNDLSARAKGIYYYLATLPAEWELNMTELFTHFTEGKDAIRTAFNELVTIGYISREKKRGQGKFSGYSYEVHWSPCTVSPYAEKPYTVNPPLLSTNKKVITKESNKEKIYKKEIGDEKDQVIFKTLPPSLKDFQTYFFDYANSYYEFPIDRIKTDGFAQNSWEYWDGERWERKKKSITSVHKTIETKVRTLNTRIKDWDAKQEGQVYEA